MKQYIFILVCTGLLACWNNKLAAQITISNQKFSFGTTGRIGFGYSANADGKTGRQLNLNNQGSLGGRLDQGDYVDFLPAFHFSPVIDGDSSRRTQIDLQARLSFYSGGTFLGNVDSRSNQGTIIALPEAFVEARNILGSEWDLWAGSRWLRYDDIHIADYFYFDDHSATGWGVKRGNTSFSMYFPAVADTSINNATPYSFNNIINGIKNLAYRQRQVFVLEHTIPFQNDKQKLKFLIEYQHLEQSGSKSLENYPSDNGFVVGVKWSRNLSTRLSGSFNQLAIRFGTGIANGGDSGNTQTWRTFGAPDEFTKTYKNAYSFTIVEHLLWNLSDSWALNPYAVYTNSKGGSKYDHAFDYYHRVIENKKSEFNVGIRGTYYLNRWLHLLPEFHFAMRKNGSEPAMSMMKFVFAPTIVPTAEKNVWARPHIRFISELSRYNNSAMQAQYSPFLQHTGAQRWGTYFGVRAEWWVF